MAGGGNATSVKRRERENLVEQAVALSIIVAVLLSLGWRIFLLYRLPLWLDESWTALLSSAPTLQSFVHQMWLDSNAPLYYFLIWIWPFESDVGLRIPGAIFTVGASVLAACRAPLERRRALFWAALLFLWIPAVLLFIDARYYALLFLISTAQVIAFVRLLSGPNLKRAAWWCTFGTLAVLTHYYAAVPAAVQGAYYLARHRQQALRTWPAALLTVPAFAWFAFHLPRLRLYAETGISWYQPLDGIQAAGLFFWPIGGGGAIGAGIVLLAFLFRERKPLPEAVVALGITSVVSAIILLVAGMSAPVFSQRYFIPIAPAALFCIAAIARPIVFLPIAAILFVPMSNWPLRLGQFEQRASFGLEEPARSIPSGATVTWMIDYAGSQIHDRAQMEDMLRDAFRRDGKSVDARWGTDFGAGDALILIYHYDKRRTVPLPQWPCRSMTAWEHITVVCLKNGRWTQ